MMSSELDFSLQEGSQFYEILIEIQLVFYFYVLFYHNSCDINKDATALRISTFKFSLSS